MRVYCYCDSCKHHVDDNSCSLEEIVISDSELTAAGFLPQCSEYMEDE